MVMLAGCFCLLLRSQCQETSAKAFVLTGQGKMALHMGPYPRASSLS